MRIKSSHLPQRIDFRARNGIPVPDNLAAQVKDFAAEAGAAGVP